MVSPVDQQIPGMPSNVNESFFDAMIRHQIGLLRVSGRVRERIFELLDATEADISAQIKRRLRNVEGIQRPSTLRRLNALNQSIRSIRGQAWKQSSAIWREELLAISRAEPEFLAQAMRTVSPVLLDLALPSPALLTSIVTKRPFEGRTLRQWASKVQADDLARIEGQIMIGVTQGQGSTQIARRIVGTVRQAGRDGVLQIARRDAQSITRTAIISITNQAKREMYLANSDILDEELYVATLDGRTTPICRSLDGKFFPLGEGPIPPLHFNCRSLRVAVFDRNVIGTRPMKASTEAGLLREFNRANGTSARRRADLPRGTKGPFDDFARGRVRELTGTIDAKISYQEWLTRQSATFQNDVLGRTRAILFRRGEVPLDRFVNRNGDQISLAQLARTDTAAFEAAGLDPANFN